MSERLVDLDLVVVQETYDAIRCSADGMPPFVWLPKSKIEYDKKENTRRTYQVTLPEWLAQDKELI